MTNAFSIIDLESQMTPLLWKLHTYLLFLFGSFLILNIFFLFQKPCYGSILHCGDALPCIAFLFGFCLLYYPDLSLGKDALDLCISDCRTCEERTSHLGFSRYVIHKKTYALLHFSLALKFGNLPFLFYQYIQTIPSTLYFLSHISKTMIWNRLVCEINHTEDALGSRKPSLRRLKKQTTFLAGLLYNSSKRISLVLRLSQIHSKISMVIRLPISASKSSNHHCKLSFLKISPWPLNVSWLSIPIRRFALRAYSRYNWLARKPTMVAFEALKRFKFDSFHDLSMNIIGLKAT